MSLYLEDDHALAVNGDAIYDKPVESKRRKDVSLRRRIRQVPSHAFTYNWSSRSSCGCCPFVSQLVSVTATASFLFGMNLGLLDNASPYISWEWNWCDPTQGEPVAGCRAYQLYTNLLTSSVFLGASIGAMTAGVFFGTFGRRGMLLLAMWVSFIGILCSACASTFITMGWARCICGFGVGLVAVCVPTYCAEVSPAASRGTYGFYNQIFITLGVLVAALLSLPLSIMAPLPKQHWTEEKIPITSFAASWWRFMLACGLIPVAVTGLLMGCVFTFETPHHYVEHKSPENARQVLILLLNKVDVSAELQEIEDASAGPRITFCQALKMADYRWAMTFGCLLAAFQQFSGVNVFMVQSHSLYAAVGLKGHSVVVVATIMTVTNFFSTFVGMILIDRIGRRKLVILGNVIMTLGFIPAVICFFALAEESPVPNWCALVGSMIFILGFALGYGPVLWVYLAEMYPSDIKGTAIGLATTTHFVTGLATHLISQHLSVRFKWLTFMIASGLGTALIAFGMRETVGRTLGDSPYIDSP